MQNKSEGWTEQLPQKIERGTLSEQQRSSEAGRSGRKPKRAALTRKKKVRSVFLHQGKKRRYPSKESRVQREHQGRKSDGDVDNKEKT